MEFTRIRYDEQHDHLRALNQSASLIQINEQLSQEIIQHKQTSEKLQQSVKRTWDILNSLFVFVGVYSLDGILQEANRAPLEAAGLQPADVIGKPFWETYWWSYSTAVQEKLKRSFREAARGRTIRYDTTARLSEKRFIDLDITFGPLYDSAGEIIQLIGSAVDITERLAAEKREAEKSAQLQNILKVNPDLYFHLNYQGVLVGFVNEKNQHRFLPIESVQQRHIYEIFPPAVASQFESAIQETIQSQAATTFEYTLELQQQSRWFQARLLPCQPEELLVIIQDITQKKYAEISLQHVHARLTEAQRQAHIGSWEWNPRENSLWWSEEIYRILGLGDPDLLPTTQTFMEMVHEEDRELVARVITNTLENNLPFSLEHRIVRPQGEVRHVHLQAGLKADPQAGSQLMYGTIQDITEKQEASRIAQEYRDELAHVSRLIVKGELIAGLSHELNQPLTAIANYCGAMKTLMEQGHDVSELRDKIEGQALRSGEIIRRLKAFSQKQQQRFLFNIHDSIRSALQMINYQIRLKQIEVQTCYKNKFTTVYADRVQVEQVLVNLFKNAVEAMEHTPSPRTLTVSTTSTPDKMIQISVSDTGCGVPEHFRSKLFTPFATSKKTGLGIGLSLSRSLIHAADGKMWFLPNTRKGASFHIQLPASQKLPE
ncbi:Sensor protein FixL [Gimesia panareensis]|uniref:histidine kinase n=1 Tax=Gimesia panareensis TaxID=2527978 RepID=A0A518FRQ8_9PLAN|nr:PAS domain S-box protein [Gimesia panareensis]QDV19005.1 Sensor protein FixL [Gimesia panareensis]